MLRRILLAGAFIFCALGIFGLINSESPSAPEAIAADSGEQAVQVWRASRDITRGQPVTRADLGEEMIAGDPQQAPQLTLKPGAIARKAIATGTLVTDILVVTPGEPDYIGYLIQPGMIPYPLTIPGGSNYRAVLTPGDPVDVVLISSLEQNLANNERLADYRGFSISPLLSGIRVLSVADIERKDAGEKDSTVVLELSRDDVSRLMVAKRIGQLDIHKSTGDTLPMVRTGDVLPGYFSVRELRGAQDQVN